MLKRFQYCELSDGPKLESIKIILIVAFKTFNLIRLENVFNEKLKNTRQNDKLSPAKKLIEVEERSDGNEPINLYCQDNNNECAGEKVVDMDYVRSLEVERHYIY